MGDTNTVIPGTMTTEDMAKAGSIDFAEQFNGSLTKFYEALGVTRKLPMAVGSVVNRYKKTVTLASDVAVEGDEIPLSKIEYEADTPVVLTLNKHRKLVTAEAIQKSGLESALEQSDADLLKELQKEIRGAFFTSLADGTGEEEAISLQGALASAWGYVQTEFEDDGVNTIAFVNPLDIAKYLGDANVTVQTAFGMGYVENFLNTTVFTSSLVPEGTVYATAPENLVLAYVDVKNGDIGKAFDLTADETGFIGIIKSIATSRASAETVTMSGIALFAERLDGIVAVEIKEGTGGGTEEEPTGGTEG